MNAKGFVVAPRFIDMHSYSDIQPLVNRKAESKVRQGVTIEVVGNYGGPVAPAQGLAEDGIERRVEELGIELGLSSFGDYLNRLNEGIFVNAAALVGYGTVKQCVMDVEDRALTERRPTCRRRG